MTPNETPPEVAKKIVELEAENARLRALLEEATDFVRHCIGSSYHETGADDEAFLKELCSAIREKTDG